MKAIVYLYGNPDIHLPSGYKHLLKVEDTQYVFSFGDSSYLKGRSEESFALQSEFYTRFEIFIEEITLEELRKALVEFFL